MGFLRGKKIVFSGFTDAQLEKEILSRGGQVMTAVSNNTDIVVVSFQTKTNAKDIAARTLNIQVIDLETFKNNMKRK
jgi:NAD-dependent DNA ligase